MEKSTGEKRKAELLRPETGKLVESRAGKKTAAGRDYNKGGILGDCLRIGNQLLGEGLS